MQTIPAMIIAATKSSNGTSSSCSLPSCCCRRCSPRNADYCFLQHLRQIACRCAHAYKLQHQRRKSSFAPPAACSIAMPRFSLLFQQAQLPRHTAHHPWYPSQSPPLLLCLHRFPKARPAICKSVLLIKGHENFRLTGCVKNSAAACVPAKKLQLLHLPSTPALPTAAAAKASFSVSSKANVPIGSTPIAL